MKYTSLLWLLLLLLMSCRSYKDILIGDVKYIKLVYTTWDQSFGFIIGSDSVNLNSAYRANSGEPLLGMIMSDSAMFNMYNYVSKKATDSVESSNIKVMPTYIIKCYLKSDTLQYRIQGEQLTIGYLDGFINHLKHSSFEEEYSIIIKEMEFRRDNIKKHLKIEHRE